MKNVSEKEKIIKPNNLRQGDTIGLFAPAGPIPDGDLLKTGSKLLESLGFKVKYLETITCKKYYLAGSDERRFLEFKELWTDPEVNALLAVRGGYGSIRILQFINCNSVKTKPKIIIGFSDLTSLLNGLYAKTSLLSYHGPMLSTLVRDGDEKAKEFTDYLKESGFSEIAPKGLNIIRPGCTKGRLIGGNLTNMVHLLGTPFEPDWQDSILFIEDINEPAYKIDRLLTHLKLAGRLDKLSGIILGKFLDNDLNTISDVEIIWQRVYELTNNHVPIWANFPVGHGRDNVILPIGIQTSMGLDNILSFQQ